MDEDRVAEEEGVEAEVVVVDKDVVDAVDAEDDVGVEVSWTWTRSSKWW